PSYLLELYPYMINSVAFKKELMHKPFQYAGADTTITMHQYFTEIYRPSFFNTLYKYTLGLPGMLLDAIRPEQAAPSPAGMTSASPDTSTAALGLDVPILSFSPSERKVITEFNNRITATYLRRTGIVQVSATMPESDLAAKLAQLTLQTLHEKASAYKTGKARLYKEFLSVQQIESKKELDQARSQLIEFNSSGGQPLNERMELQSNYEVSLDRYNTLTQQLNRMEQSIKEKSHAFRLLDDITVPSTQIQPKRTVIVVLSVFIGFFIAVSWITVSFLLNKEKWSLS